MGEPDALTLWTRVLDALAGRIAPATLEAWLRPLEVLDAADDGTRGMLVLKAPNDFARDWAARHYGPLLEETLSAQTGRPWSLQWTVARDPASATTNAAPAPAVAPKPAAPKPAPAPRASRAPTLNINVANTPPRAQSSSPPTKVLAPRPTSSSSSSSGSSARSAALSSSTPSRPLITTGSAPGAISRGLHPRYTFDNFVIGPSNQLAHAASTAMAQAERRFNPLFLCGSTGLGKTHLANAVGHKLLELEPNARVIYVSAEHFTNEFIGAIQSHTMDQFRGRYRNDCDALLIDDVQFLAGREQTQEEFFHTFNALYLQGRPIVLTSDVLPHDLKGMAERLVSRFGSGLVAEVGTPEMETRVAIVRKKAELEGIHLDDEAAFLLAGAVASNVRELEGMLMKLAIKASLSGQKGVDTSVVREALRIPIRRAVTSVEDVQRAVCEFYKVKLAELTGKERHQGIALPRQVAMYLARERVGASFPQIGHRFGGKDHTTVIAAVNKIKRLLGEGGEALQRDIDAISTKLGPVSRDA